MTGEKREERLKKDIDAMAKVVEENREGLSKLAEEDEAEKKRGRGIKGYLKKIKNRLKDKRAETVEIHV
ncbi:MAG: hypothetical protein ACI9LV_000358 [Candidatus Nanohaloarchaea archaeon]|jgi:hypothetical protein